MLNKELVMDFAQSITDHQYRQLCEILSSNQSRDYLDWIMQKTIDAELCEREAMAEVANG